MTGKREHFEYITFVNEERRHFLILTNYHSFCMEISFIFLEILYFEGNLMEQTFGLWVVLMKSTQDNLVFFKATKISEETENLTEIKKKNKKYLNRCSFCVTMSMYFSGFSLILESINYFQ